MGFYNENNYKIKVCEGLGLILKHKKIIQKEKKWLETWKSPKFRGSF